MPDHPHEHYVNRYNIIVRLALTNDYHHAMEEDFELTFYQQLCGEDLDKLAALEAYVSLLAARDDEDGKPTESLDAQIAAARSELRYQLGL